MTDPSVKTAPLITAMRLKGSSLQTIPDILSGGGVVGGSGTFLVWGVTTVSLDKRLGITSALPGELAGVLFSTSLWIFGGIRLISSRASRIGSGGGVAAGGVNSSGGNDFTSEPCSERVDSARLVCCGGVTVAVGEAPTMGDDFATEPVSEGADEICLVGSGGLLTARGDDLERKLNSVTTA